MKKILFALIVPILFVGVFASAQTTEQILIDAAQATLNNARQTGQTIKVSTIHKIQHNDTSRYPTDKNDMELASNLSSMRTQAELYYSNSSSYGPAVSSCAQGMFGSSGVQGGLKTLIDSSKKYSKSISCFTRVTTPKVDGSYIVTAKLKTGGYWCVDSRGTSQRVSAPAKKGNTKCGKEFVIFKKPINITLQSHVDILPKSNDKYDYNWLAKFTSSADKDFNHSMILVMRNSIGYLSFPKLWSRENVGDSMSPEMVTAIQNGFIQFDEPTSTLAKYFSVSEMELHKLIISFWKNPFTAKIVRYESPEKTIYEVQISIDSLLKNLNPLAYKQVFTGLGLVYRYDNEKDRYKNLLFTVTVQNGLITNIKSKTPFNTKNESGSESITYEVKVWNMPLDEYVGNNFWPCTKVFSSGKYVEDVKEICGKYGSAEQEAAAKERASQINIQSALSSMRPQAELYYSNNNNYGSNTLSCSQGFFAEGTEGSLKFLIDDVKQKSSDVSCTTGSNDSNTKADKWRVQAKLNNGKYWCVDSTGNSKEKIVPQPPDTATCE